MLPEIAKYELGATVILICTSKGKIAEINKHQAY